MFTHEGNFEGKKFNTKWLKDFGIIDVTLISLPDFKEYESDLSLTLFYTDDFLLEIIILFAISFYA